MTAGGEGAGSHHSWTPRRAGSLPVGSPHEQLTSGDMQHCSTRSDLWVALAQPPDGQRLRARGPNQRNAHRASEHALAGGASWAHNATCFRIAVEPVSLSRLVLDHPIGQMGHNRGLRHARDFQFNRLAAEMVEQADTSAQQDRHQVQVECIKQSSFLIQLDLRQAPHRVGNQLADADATLQRPYR